MAEPRFIVVQKVVKDRNGLIKQSPETIRLDLIRSAREWKKKPEHNSSIEGEMTVLYMIPDTGEKAKRPRINEDKKSDDSKILIAESKEHFDKRVGAVNEGPSVVIKRLGEDEPRT